MSVEYKMITKELKVATCCIIYNADENAILFLRRSPTDHWKPNSWCLPGGHVDLGEKPRETVVREIFEECNLKVDLKNAWYVDCEIHEETSTLVMYYFTWTYAGEVLLSGEHSDYKWVDVKDIHMHDCVTEIRKLEIIKELNGTLKGI